MLISINSANTIFLFSCVWVIHLTLSQCNFIKVNGRPTLGFLMGWLCLYDIYLLRNSEKDLLPHRNVNKPLKILYVNEIYIYIYLYM